MGRKALHTQEQVFQAADELAASGIEVTPTTLRDALGGGSLTTIYKHIDAWQATRLTAPAPIILEMPDSVKAAFAQCWQAAASEAGKEIAAIRESADAEIKATKRRLDEAVLAIEQLEQEAEMDAIRLEEAETSLAAERSAAQHAATEAAAREAALSATVEQMRRQIEAQQTELVSVHAEAEAARGQYAAELTRLTADFTRQLAEQAATLQAAQVDADRLRGQLEEANTRERVKVEETATAKADAARVADQLKDTKTRSAEVIGKLEEDKQRLEAELSAERKDARELAMQLSRVQGEMDALRAQIAERQPVDVEAKPRKGKGGV
ncbi:hypothetical protein A1507_11750 [Methylomonas koyamae]|uniref:KfrA N-terminal DNA-binding domain-containing protein n=1 Tax=Methylomonas koyamae TaxID=702114 RepID=A0A177NHS5_9GAMM|nr:DNA-binding protein [Methylomonas koyamae]OAI16610.1 hypothetical protein A1507_11750 [Methylomonas koyamae]